MTSPLRPEDPRFLGRYELVGRLGEGGMGAVYLAHDGEGRPVAVKVIRREYARQEQFRARFRSEVDRARQVPAFCTAAVLDADPEHETPYLVVEYVDGPSLAEVVRDQGPLRGGSLHGVAVGVASALVAIHGAGIIHRDLKPANVLFALGAPKVIDFGIAKSVEATSNLTGTQEMVGTLAYMSPERFTPDTDQRLTPAADVFAWGALVAYAATGRSPFDGDNPVAIAGRILTQPPTLDGLPPGLGGLVERALDKDPARRPGAQELLDALLTAGAETPPGGVRRVSRGGPADGAGRTGVVQAADVVQAGGASRRWPAVSAAGAVLVLAIAGGWAGSRLGRTSAAAGAAERTDATVAPAVSATSGVPAADIADSLDVRGAWAPSGKAAEGCRFDKGLVVRTKQDVRCTAGPAKAFTGDVTIQVRADIGAASCATVHFRDDAAGDGYLTVVCDNRVEINRSVDGELTFDGSVDDLAVGSSQLRFGTPGEHLIRLDIAGDVLTVTVDGKADLRTELSDRSLTGGRVTFGARKNVYGRPATVTYHDVRITAG